MQFEQLKNLAKWPDDVLLIHVAIDGTAIVRPKPPQEIEGAWVSFDTALANAQNFISIDLHMKRIMVWLEDGAEWDPDNGTLV